MQYGGPTAWKLRAALAATLVPTYGIYTGYELMECVARPGVEEQIDNEKYEYKNRHWEDYEPGGPKEGQSLAPYLTRLNEIRRAHPALRWLRHRRFPRTAAPRLTHSPLPNLPPHRPPSLMRYSNTPGSSAPGRVPIGTPSSGEKPMVESKLLPACIAHRLAPLPRCAAITRPSARFGATFGNMVAIYS